MDFSLWQIVGGFLILWVIYDLFSGQTYLHRKIIRRHEAALYWTVLAVWLAIGIATLSSI